LSTPGAVGIGLLGLGVVGGGVARVLSDKSEHLASLAGVEVSLRRALVRDPSKPRDGAVPAEVVTTNADDVLDDPGIDVVVEVMGGRSPAREYILRAIASGKHVVTANKEVMASSGPEILAAASERGVRVLFEASVGGGTPIISPLVRDLAANSVRTIRAIINGTTNYILTRMATDGLDFEVALKEAQELGYAEADPANDIEGVDAAYKLAVLSTLAFRASVRDVDVYHEGITKLQARDFQYAGELGYSIKLLALASRTSSGVHARVHPTMVPADELMAKVSGVYNSVELETDLAGLITFHGRGAGSLPTASAVLGDVMDIVRGLETGTASPVVPPSSDLRVLPFSELETRYYLRLTVADRPGVLAQIATILGDLHISIDSVIQKGFDETAGQAELVLMTHKANEDAVQRAVKSIDELQAVRGIGNLIRVEDWPQG
jgi:homoserine dehydrogenase